jgi:hypothetical protein
MRLPEKLWISIKCNGISRKKSVRWKLNLKGVRENLLIDGSAF